MERFDPNSLHYGKYLALALPPCRPVIVDLNCGTGALLRVSANSSTRFLLGARGDPLQEAGKRAQEPELVQVSPSPPSLPVTCITHDLTLLYPLLKRMRFSADCFVLHPPADLQWDRDRLRLLSESECPVVRSAFGAQDGRTSERTIDSTVASMCIALDLCSVYGEGFLIASEAALQQLIGVTDAPHGALRAQVWAHVVIGGDNWPAPAIMANDQARVQMGAIYFARDHTSGPALDYRVSTPSEAERVLSSKMRVHRKGAEIRVYAQTESTERTWQAARERASGEPIRLLDKPARASYTITLGPGLVRYMELEPFLEKDVEDTLAHLRAMSANPAFEFPNRQITPRSFEFLGAFIAPIADSLLDWIELDLPGIDAVVQGDKWDTRLRIHHALCRFCLAEAMPSCVYATFHELLRLQTLALEECLKAWVGHAFGNNDITHSYLNDPGHLVVTPGVRQYVFAKTPFVLQKLNAAQQDEVEQKALAESEVLRRSRFDCFIYLMEDLRNRSFKIGRSRTPGKRERTLQSEVPQVVMRFSIPAEEEQERQLHSRFECRRSRGEWFALTSEDLVWIVAYLKANGDASRAMVDYNWLGSVQFAAAPNTSVK